jgi:hypothetical protein
MAVAIGTTVHVNHMRAVSAALCCAECIYLQATAMLVCMLRLAVQSAVVHVHVMHETQEGKPGFCCSRVCCVDCRAYRLVLSCSRVCGVAA